MEQQNKKYLTFNEAAAFLGYKKSFLYKLVADEVLTVFKPANGRILFDLEKLQAWILNGRQAKQDTFVKAEDLRAVILATALKAVELMKRSDIASATIPSSTNENSNG